jgi:hypothetical protein
MHAIKWLLTEHGVGEGLDGRWADFRFLLTPPVGLKGKMLKAIDLYPCDLLFVHRDAENASREDRKQEIEAIVDEIEAECSIHMPAICVIPIRMMEAWLLMEESAIRRAAGNPAGRVPLGLPRINRIESTPDPKRVLFNALETASGYSGRRLAKLNFPALRYRVAELISDHSQLRKLSAFRALEAEIEEVLHPVS